MGNSFRPQPLPAYYPDNKTPVSEDLLEVGLLVAFGMIAFSFFIIVPGIRGMERLWAFVRVAVALWVGAVILVSNFGYGWYTGTLCTRTQYKGYTGSGFPQEIQAEVGLHVGLRGINITLLERKAGDNCPGLEELHDYEPPFPNETINYNEQFWWANPWAQGRLGFGRFAGRLNQEFRAAEARGMPYPILWVSEYFTLDGEQIRWGRKFRIAGWYTHQALWLAFATYLVSMLVFIFAIRLGAYWMLCTGLVMLLGSFAFAIIVQNDPPIKIPFSDGILVPDFGWSWYLVLFTAIAVIALSLIVLALEFFLPRSAAAIFHHSVVEEDDFFQVEEDETVEAEGYGVASRGSGRGRTTRRGVSRYRKTQRRPRSTQRARGGSQRLKEEVALEEIPHKE